MSNNWKVDPHPLPHGSKESELGTVMINYYGPDDKHASKIEIHGEGRYTIAHQIARMLNNFDVRCINE